MPRRSPIRCREPSPPGALPLSQVTLSTGGPAVMAQLEPRPAAGPKVPIAGALGSRLAASLAGITGGNDDRRA